MRNYSEIAQSEEKKITWKEILLMFVILLLTGNPYINEVYQTALIISFIIPLVHITRNSKNSISYKTIFIFLFLLGYEVIHAVMYKLDYSLTIFKIFLVLLLANVTVDILKDRFVETLVRTMVLISLISFLFVIISYIPGINHFFYNLGETIFPIAKDWKGHAPSTIIIYTFSWEFFSGELSYVRNSGIFWESGAFAVFLNITLFLHYSTRNIISTKDLFDKESIILIIAAISTTSTMGILALLVILVFFSQRIKSVVRYMIILLITVIATLAFSSVEFLGKKITKQLNESRTTSNRFGSALKDFEDFSERPILGWSRRNEVVFGTTKFTAKTHRPNGLTNQLRSYGLLYNAFYFFLVFQSFLYIYRYHHHRLNYLTASFGIFLLFIVSFSEPIFDLIFLKSLVFLDQAFPHFSATEKNNSLKPLHFISQKPSAFLKRFTY